MPPPKMTDELLQGAVNLVATHGSTHKACLATGIPTGTLAYRCTMAAHRGITVEGTAQVSAPAKNPAAACPGKFGRTHLVIPDVQAKPGVPLEHLTWAGQYVAEHRPDVIIIIGDFADMPSLSSYDKGKRAAENRRYRDDIKATKTAMALFMAPFCNIEDYNPYKVLTLGNHEHRITRFSNDTPEMHETVSINDLGYEEWGWEVHPFLDVVMIDSIAYSHYFYTPNTGRAYGGTAHAKLKNVGMSFTMGHQQGIDIAMRELADGTRQVGLVAGSFYQHPEEYRGPQANGHWHGIVMKHEVKDGAYDPSFISLDYLRHKYG